MHTVEIMNKSMAIALGKDRGWCTANPGTHWYDRDYNQEKGRLFVIYETSKKKPQYQVFFAHMGGVELRAKFNEFVNWQDFIRGEGATLYSWFHGLLRIPDKATEKRTRMREGYGRLHVQLTVPRNMVHRVHRTDELPNLTGRSGRGMHEGVIFHVAQNNKMYITIWDNGDFRYKEAELFELEMQPVTNMSMGECIAPAFAEDNILVRFSDSRGMLERIVAKFEIELWRRV